MSEEPQKPVKIQLFGHMAVSFNGESINNLGSSLGRAILAYLALYYDTSGIPRRTLADLFWDEKVDKEKYAPGSLAKCLQEIRGAFPDSVDILSRTRGVVFLERAVVQIDLQDFNEACAKGSVDSLRQAIALYHGPLLYGWEGAKIPKAFLHRIIDQREASKQKYVQALNVLITDAVRRKDHRKVVEYTNRALVAEPSDEQHYSRKIKALLGLKKFDLASEVVEEMRHHLNSISPATASLAATVTEIIGTVRQARDQNHDGSTTPYGTAIAAKSTSETVEQDQFRMGLTPEAAFGGRKDQAKQADADHIREALLRDIRFTELPLFGEGAETEVDNLVQDLTIAPESSRSFLDQPDASRYKEGEHEPNGQDDEAGKLLRKGPSVSVTELLTTLSQNKKAFCLPLLAPPGAGKTTLLRWLTLQAAKEAAFLKRADKSLIPAYIPVQDWYENIHDDVAEYLAAQHKNGPEADTWRHWLSNGECLLLLDGLELVSSPRKVRALLREYPKCPSILACRTIMRERLESALVGISTEAYYLLEPLSEGQQIRYIDAYPNLSEIVCNSLKHAIRERNDLRLMCSNPFVLSLLCYTVQHNESLSASSSSRSTLYNVAVLTALSERPQDGERLALYQKNPVHNEKLHDALAHAALYAVHEMLAELSHLEKQGASFDLKQSIVQKANKGYISSKIFVQGLEDWQKVSGVACDVEGALLPDICANSHLVSGNPIGVSTQDILFTHRTLEEYLIAAGLADAAVRADTDSQADAGTSSGTDAGWNAIRPYVDALSWIPEYQETLVFLAGILLKRRKDAILARMLRFLSKTDEDDTFRHRLSLAALSLGQLTGEPMLPELSSCLQDISQMVIESASEVIDRAYADDEISPSSDFPFWLEAHPLGRALSAIGSAYRMGEDAQMVGIPLGKLFYDPANLNKPLLVEDLSSSPWDGFGDFVRGKPHKSSTSRLITESWILTLLGPAMALGPIRNKLMERADSDTLTCTAHPFGAALRYSGEKDALRWFEWIKHMLDDYPPHKVVHYLPVFTLISASMRSEIIEAILSYIEETPVYTVRKNAERNEYLQDWTAGLLFYLLQGYVPEWLRSKAQTVLSGIPHDGASQCLLQLGLPDNLPESIRTWRHESENADGRTKYLTALRLWAEDISLVEALPQLTETYGTLVFEAPAFVNALTDEQRRILITSMVKEDIVLLDNQEELLSRKETILTLARSGSAELRRELAGMLRSAIREQHRAETMRFLWQTLLQLGEDAPHADELQEYAYLVASTWGRAGYQQLISLSGGLARNDSAVRSQLEQYVEGKFPPEFYERYKQKRIAEGNDEIARLERDFKNAGAKGLSGFLAKKFFNNSIASSVNARDALVEQPAKQFALPGGEYVQYAAAIALSHGGVSFFSEDIRRLVQDSYSFGPGTDVCVSNWGSAVARKYQEKQHPWLGWIQAGVRIFPKDKGGTKAFLAIERAAQAVSQQSR